MGLGDVIQGAVGGGLGGFGIGGPVGGLLGGIGGGLAGYFGGNKDEDARKRMLEYYNSLGNGPQNGPAYQADYSGFRTNQQNLINQLEAMAQGRGPSLATEQFKASTDRNIAQQQALANSGMGNPTAAAFGAQNNSAMLGSRAAQDAAQARMQEQLNAVNQLGINLYGARNADEDINRFNAGQSNQNQWNNQNSSLDTNRLRAMLLGGMQTNQPSLGQQILAGGAGLYSMAASNKAANRSAGTPQFPQSVPQWSSSDRHELQQRGY